MSDVQALERFALAFAYEGVRAFFRPKLKEQLELPLRDKHLFSEAELAILKNRVSPYWYVGTVIEVLVGTLTFLLGVGIAIVVTRYGETVLGLLFRQRSVDGLVEGLAYGVVFVDLVLFIVFTMKVLHATLRRL